jgi:hypothetical protein
VEERCSSRHRLSSNCSSWCRIRVGGPSGEASSTGEKEGKEGGSGRELEVDRLVFFLLSCLTPDVGRIFALPQACRQVGAVFVISCKDLVFCLEVVHLLNFGRR